MTDLSKDQRRALTGTIQRSLQAGETGMSDADCNRAGWHVADDLVPLVEGMITEVVERAKAEGAREALLSAADELTWTPPEKCPCASPEACCGSEASCDAMRPSVRVVGADWLRARADSLAAQPASEHEHTNRWPCACGLTYDEWRRAQPAPEAATVERPKCNWPQCRSPQTGKCFAWCKCRCHDRRKS